MGQQHILSNSILLGPALWHTCFISFYYCDLLGDLGEGFRRGYIPYEQDMGLLPYHVPLFSDRNIPWTGSSRRVTNSLHQFLCECVFLSPQLSNLEGKRTTKWYLRTDLAFYCKLLLSCRPSNPVKLSTKKNLDVDGSCQGNENTNECSTYLNITPLYLRKLSM